MFPDYASTTKRGCKDLFVVVKERSHRKDPPLTPKGWGTLYNCVGVVKRHSSI
jgi:hypothetical protein